MTDLSDPRPVSLATLLRMKFPKEDWMKYWALDRGRPVLRLLGDFAECEIDYSFLPPLEAP